MGNIFYAFTIFWCWREVRKKWDERRNKNQGKSARRWWIGWIGSGGAWWWVGVKWRTLSVPTGPWPQSSIALSQRRDSQNSLIFPKLCTAPPFQHYLLVFHNVLPHCAYFFFRKKENRRILLRLNCASGELFAAHIVIFSVFRETLAEKNAVWQQQFDQRAIRSFFLIKILCWGGKWAFFRTVSLERQKITGYENG